MAPKKKPSAIAVADNQMDRYITTGSAELPELPLLLAGWQWAEDTGGKVTLTDPRGEITTPPAMPNTAIVDALRWQTIEAPPVMPFDLDRDWVWQVEPEGMRLFQPDESWVTDWRPPALADEAFAQARATLDNHQPDRYRPGPDAVGIYRRPSHLNEHGNYAPTDLVDGRWQPREAYDEQALSELVESVKEHGVIAPLLVLVNEEGYLEIIGGHRRKRAALASDRPMLVPVKILEVTLQQAWELALIDNDQRADLNDVERGKAYERIIVEQSISEVELAKRLGRARGYIQQRRKLAAAAPELQRALTSGQISFTQARAIAEGSGGHHGAQEATLQKLRQDRTNYNRTMSGEEAQKEAERLVIKIAFDQIKELGWKEARFWLASNSTLLFYAPTAKPERWSAAEVLAVVAEQRRPPAEGAAAPLFPDDRHDLERRGWSFQDYAAPWQIATRGKELILGDATDLAPALAAARADMVKLHDRFVAAGWEAIWQGHRLRATPPPTTTSKGKPKKLTPVEASSWSEAEKLIRMIEKGEWSPDARLSQGYDNRVACHRCGTKTSDWGYVSGESYCRSCLKQAEAEAAAKKAQLATMVDAQLSAWLNVAPPLALQLLGLSGNGSANDRRRVADGDLSAEQLQAVAKAMFQQAAWTWRNELALLAPTEPATAVASKPKSAEPPWTEEQVDQALDDIENRWAAGQAEVGDGELLLSLVDLLDEIDGLSEQARERLIARIGQMQARLEEEGVAS